MLKENRVQNLPPYLFAQIDETVDGLRNNGIDILPLSKSDPDLPTPEVIVKELIRTVQDPINHHYPKFDGLRELREAIANWYHYRFNVSLDVDKEILPLLGSKEGIVHICEAFISPNQVGLVPEPSFPAYKTGILLAGGQPYSMPLLPENHFLPNFSSIPKEVAQKAALMFLNYPNNPTGAVASKDFFAKAVHFAKQNNIIICHDSAYCQTTFDGYKAPSFLEVNGAKEVGVEFFTFSKAFNMAGWRLGFLVGNEEIIRGLKTIETHVNAGIFYPIQYAGAKGLDAVARTNFFNQMNEIYRKRRNRVVEFFNQLGWNISNPLGAVYIWLPVPEGFTSESFTNFLLEEAKVAVSPGNGFGDYGEGYIRICLTYPDMVIEKALKNIQAVLTSKIKEPTLV